MEQLPKNDPLLVLRALPEILMQHKIIKYVVLFIICYMTVTMILCSYVLATVRGLWDLFWSQYSLLAFGSSIGFSCYFVAFWKGSEFIKLRRRVFANYWPLTSLGEESFQKIKKLSIFANVFMVATILASLATSTAGLPWVGDEYDIMFPVRVYTDYFGERAVPLLVPFYLAMYCTGFVMISTGFIFVHFALHLKFQFFLLNKRLDGLRTEPLVNDFLYQNHVKEELTCCIEYHQKLLKVAKEMNDIVYYPIFIVVSCGIMFSVCLVFYMKNFKNSFVRGTTMAMTGTLTTFGFGFTGQLMENESGRLFDTSVMLPWHLWCLSNRKLYHIFLTKCQYHVSFSSSGIINLNHTLFISLYTKITSILSFLLNVSKKNHTK
ncbi:odorant receptor 314 [Tribolium castaneum]|uniref:Odorant receptor n=1 Tax=Tribolium castaneum TaxID=7070 RepID=D2A0G1_TRICA|nr:odorant receptor 314 [Tribolium castaneum]